MRSYLCGLTLLLAVSTATMATAGDLGLRGLGGQVGFSDTGVGSALTFGANANLGEFIPNLRFQPSVTYWKKTYDSILFSSNISMFRINGDAKYFFQTGGSIEPYAGGGLAYARTSISDEFVSISASEIQINLLGGAETQLSPSVRGFGELRVEDSHTHLAVGVTMAMRE